jgi:beta-galactosidase
MHFKIEGQGTIVGVPNANRQNFESYQRRQRKAWHGKCVVIIKTTEKPGDIILKVTSDGHPVKTVVLHSL